LVLVDILASFKELLCKFIYKNAYCQFLDEKMKKNIEAGVNLGWNDVLE